MLTINKILAKAWRLSIYNLPRGYNLTRYFMYQHLEKVGEFLPSKEYDVLSISKSSGLCDVLKIKIKTLVQADYPEHNILNLQFSDAQFDLVISDQVLEHIEGIPQQAIDESFRVLRKGGIAVHTTCFLYRIHGCPGDYWRFTHEALKLLHRRFDKIIDCSSWGNFKALALVRLGLGFKSVPHAQWHPLHRVATQNNPEWPIVTWIVAQK